MTIADSGFMMENGASCLPHTPEEEKRIIDELARKSEANVKEGNLFYVVSNRWYSSWKKYVEQGTGERLNDEWYSESQQMDLLSSKIVARPGPIDNSDIVVNESEGNDLQLNRMLVEERDYVLVSQEVWEKLSDWYKGGPALPRKLISQGDVHKNLMVEVYPLCLKFIDSRDNSQTVIRLSKKASVQELYEKVCTLRGIEQQKAHIWDYFNMQKYTLLDASNQTLEQLNLQMDQEILLEVQVDGNHSSQFSMDPTGNELALVPIEPSRSSMTIAGGPTLSNGHSMDYSYNLPQGSALSSSASADTDDKCYVYNPMKKGDRGGLAGLQNLGNTCFMNSSIQCLVHTPPLVEYFLQDYSDEINTENPLGMHGELALAFGELLRKLWSSGRTTIAPRAFKGKLARFAPQFSGYNQHDSQELLAFLLDGLHEDLNRVKNKPYIETKDSDGRPDEEVADECWKNHRARNDSLIVDVCQGQYKSTLVCPVCSKISITFDPFMYLSLPLPSTVTRSMTVTVVYGDGRGLPMPYTLTLIKDRCIKDLIAALGTACCLKSDESLMLAEVYEHRIYRYLDNLSEPLSSIKNDDRIVAYRYSKEEAAFKTRLEIIYRWQEKSTSDSLKGQRKLFGTPLVAYLGEDKLSGVDIDRAVSRILSPLKRAVKLNSIKENGLVSQGIDEASNSHNSRPMDNIELEETSSGELSFHLFLADERGSSCKPIEKYMHISSGKPIKIFLDWTNQEDEGISKYIQKKLRKRDFTIKRERRTETEMAKQEPNCEGSSVVSDLINFLNASPTAFHAVDEAKKRLQNAGYEPVSEREDWKLEAGKKYFFTRNYSTIVAFAIGKKYVAGNGFHIVGAHTDSPCLKLKPVSKVVKGGYLEVGVQTYGGGLWHTWFDRDLTIAGRVIVREEKDGSVSYSHKLVRIEEPIMRIPTLAIHLDRDVRDAFKVNTQSHLLPVLATSIKAELNKVVAENGQADSDAQTHGKKSNERNTSNNSKHHSLLLQLLADQLGCEPEHISDFELQACDTQPSVVAGATKEFIFSGRLDNLCMSFCSLKALIESSESNLEDETGVRLVALFDHEEVGSDSAQGAGSPAMLNTLSRITNSFTADSKLLEKAIQRSFLVSADMAHALHPNYMDKHEDNHQPKLHGGLVIKHNANQRYATNAVTSLIFREIARNHNLPVQDFAVRNDMACGSTIGPILASGVGIRTVDVGAPQLSMHSIREMCAVDDVQYSYEHFKAFFQEFSHLDEKIKVDA